MNRLSSLHKTYREYSLAHNDDLIRFWRLEIKGQVIAGHQGQILCSPYLMNYLSIIDESVGE